MIRYRVCAPHDAQGAVHEAPRIRVKEGRKLHIVRGGVVIRTLRKRSNQRSEPNLGMLYVHSDGVRG